MNALWAATRRRQGATTVELGGDATKMAEALEGGLLPVASEPESAGAAAWVVDAAGALQLAGSGIDGRRITLVHEEPREAVLDALARSEAAYLRTGRSRVAEAAELARLPGIETSVSVFVDTVEDAMTALGDGATDLLLRDWDTERIGALRDAVPNLLERVAVRNDVTVDEARHWFDAAVFRVYLGQVDASGTARPRYAWAPGMDGSVPVPPARLSAQWPDAAWCDRPSGGLDGASPELRSILERSLAGERPSRDDVERLFESRGADVEAVAAVADELRRRTNGDVVTYVVNRNINYTNQCYFKCGFCAFSKGPRSLNLRGEPYLMSVAQVVERAVEAWHRGATEVCLQGGIHPEFTGDFYVAVLEGIKDAVPDMHCHGFTPLEVWQGAETLGISVQEFLVMLKEAGLGTLPGTAAEILDDDVRRHLCPDKIRTSQWAEVMITAHDLGLRSTSTMMFGHIDSPRAWANHYEVLRQIQQRTGGITEFVPLPFVHMGAPIFLQGRSRPGPTWDEVVLVHAVARIAFDGLIDNIQASWVKLGLEGGRRLLDAGCNDLGGTLMDEIISRSAGASHGQAATPDELEGVIRSAGRTPARRSTLYGVLESDATS